MAVYPHVSIDIYNYNREKVVNLYDSALDSPGQAYDIVHVNELNGWQELTFVMPYVMEEEYNHRWDYIKPEYKVCLTVGNVREWFSIQQPKAKRDSKAINNTVKCTAECDILKTKNIYAEFDDENGIGTLAELATKVLTGTGWTLGYYDIPLEEDGETEKIRSLKSSGKAGAYKLITTLCDLFKVYPVFDSDAHTVNFYGLTNRDIHREFLIGGASKEKADVEGGGSIIGVGIIGIMVVGYDSTGSFLKEGNVVSSAYGVTALTVEKDSSKIITRMYVEGEYGDDGYVGIDSVNPTGLTYIMNFDYYRDAGLFTPEHEEALATYEEEMSAIVRGIREYSAWIATKSNELNRLWGQWKYVEYIIENGQITKHILGGDVEEEDATIAKDDLILIVGKDGDNYTYRTVNAGTGGSVSFVSTDEYAIKYILANPQDKGQTWFEPKYFKPAGYIGFKEVSIEAKEAANKDLDRQIAIVDETIQRFIDQGLPVPQSLIDERARYVAQKNENLSDIQGIYDGNPGTEEGSTEAVGLKEMTYKAMEMRSQLEEHQAHLDDLIAEQTTVENAFVSAMGDFLKDGYWSNKNYIEGQEQALYDDAVEVLASMSQPSVKYTVQRANLSANLGYKVEDFRVNSQIRLYDPFLGVNDLVYIKKITKYLDAPWKDTVEIANEKDITISGQSLDSTLSRITTLASSLDERQSLYERSQAIGSNGTFSVERFEGMIDTLRNKLDSAVSGWYTDDNGNIMFISADGQRAMKLTGEGLAIAPNKNADGEWNWRTFGDGRGFTADLIVAGIIKANLIEAGSITVDKLASNTGNEIDLSGNAVVIAVGEQAEAAQTAASAAQTAAQSAQEGVENMEIGGRNLIWGTLDPSLDVGRRPCINGYHGNENVDGGEAVVSDGELTAVRHGLKIENTSAVRPFIRFGSSTPATAGMYGLVAGETYTLSCDAEFKLLSGDYTGTTEYNTYIYLFHDEETHGTFVPGTIAEGTAYNMGTITQLNKGTVITKHVEWTFMIPEDTNILYFLFANSNATASRYASGDYISISNLKLEKGDKATDWTAAPEDYEDNIDQAQQTADAAQSMAATAQSNLDAYKSVSRSTFTQLQDAIEARVTTSPYDENNAKISDRISAVEVRTGAVETSVQNIEKGIGTHFIVSENMVQNTQVQEQEWEQQLTASDLSLVNKRTGVVAASFGVQGGYADKLRSNKELSVGTTNDGWYDMVALNTGVADKWRNGDTPPVVVPLIIEEPVNCYVDTTESSPQISFTVLDENAASHQWYLKGLSEDDTHWSAIPLATGVTYTAPYGPTSQTYEYRCEITGTNGGKAYTRACGVFVYGNPEILGQPTPETTVNVGEIATVSIVATGATSYTWQHMENGSWVDDVTTASPERSTMELAEMTKTYRCVVNNSIGSIPSESYTITWE